MKRKNQDNRRYGIQRREFFKYVAAVSAIPTIALHADEPVAERPRFGGNPFTLGVASGDPEADGVVLWTRLAPEQDPKSPLVGTELVGTAMTSGGNGGNVIPEYERAAAQNDFVRWYNSNRGYVTCDLTPKSWTTQ